MLKKFKSPEAVIARSMMVTALTLTGSKPAEARGPLNCPARVCSGQMFCSGVDPVDVCLNVGGNKPGCFGDVVMAWCSAMACSENPEQVSVYCVWE